MSLPVFPVLGESSLAAAGLPRVLQFLIIWRLFLNSGSVKTKMLYATPPAPAGGASCPFGFGDEEVGGIS